MDFKKKKVSPFVPSSYSAPVPWASAPGLLLLFLELIQNLELMLISPTGSLKEFLWNRRRLHDLLKLSQDFLKSCESLFLRKGRVALFLLLIISNHLQLLLFLRNNFIYNLFDCLCELALERNMAHCCQHALSITIIEEALTELSMNCFVQKKCRRTHSLLKRI